MKKNEIRESQVLPLAALPIGNNDSVKGVSAPFTAYMNDQLLVAGGCNFPGLPPSQGGKKQYYKEIYAYTPKENVWRQIGSLPNELAYGASVVYGDEWICLGGNNNEGSYGSVYVIRMHNGECNISSLPDLPAAMDNFAAVESGKKLYVAGGNTDGMARNSVYVLDLEKQDGWERIADFPGATRIQPQLLRGMNGTVLLLGGFQGGSVTEAPVLPTTVYCYDPVSVSWTEKNSLPLSSVNGEPLAMVGGFGVNINDSTLLIGGGVDRVIFTEALDAERQISLAREKGETIRVDSLIAAKKSYLTHPVEWYAFNSDIYILHLKSNEWEYAGTFPQSARAGAGAAMQGQTLYVVDGELKPGVRTDEVNAIRFDF